MTSSLRATAANMLWVASCRPEWQRFQRALPRVEAAQARLLMRYVVANRDTDFGRRHNFAGITSAAEFQKAVPLGDYDDYAEPVAAIGQGQAGVLTAEPVRMFELSSGSTAASKLIPYTATLKAEFQRGLAPWIYDLYSRQPDLQRGPAYWSITPLTNGPRATPGGIPIGFEADSAYLGALGQRLLEAVLAVPNAVKHIPSAASFRYATLLFLLRQPGLRLISVWHPTFLSLLLAPLPEWWERLLADIADGTLTPPEPLEPDLQRALSRHLRPDPRRARQLAGLGPTDRAAIWPELRLLSCWADGPAAGYAQAVADSLFPAVRLQPKGLLATEAFVSLPMHGAEGSVLAVTSHFFEFLPLDSADRPMPDAPRLAHELAEGLTYALVVTTGGGLYRYALHDLVEVTGRLGQAPCLRFVGKTDLVSDRFGEKLNERFVAQVGQALFQRHQLAPLFNLLAPDEAVGGLRYTLYLELPPGQHARASTAATALQADLERLLCQNFHYAYCRQLGQLGAAQVVFTRPGAAERYLRACQARGQKLGGIKPVLLQKSAGWGPELSPPVALPMPVEIGVP